MAERRRGTRLQNGGIRVSLYFPAGLLEEIEREGDRLDRPLSWVIRRAWELAKADIKRAPTPDENE